ncbi:hypothetical protein DX903_12870, partial [Adlercreutzia equolifaciens]
RSFSFWFFDLGNHTTCNYDHFTFSSCVFSIGSRYGIAVTIHNEKFTTYFKFSIWAIHLRAISQNGHRHLVFFFDFPFSRKLNAKGFQSISVFGNDFTYFVHIYVLLFLYLSSKTPIFVPL